GAVAVALDHMHRREPQALRLLADGRLAVDVADDHVWVGSRQGLFATMAVSALAGHPSRSDLERLVWAPLNHPLRAWPTADWFAGSGAVEEIPVGPLPAYLAGYDTHVPSVLNATLQHVDDKGLAGLMTFGLYPRLWGNPVYGDELDCGGDDPTPAEAWDDTYWCSTWTDYHNTVATAPLWAMRSGEVRVLDEIAFPGALRTLHTQVWRCGPDDGNFYCGQAPAGYGGYRADFNSSHAYFENLFHGADYMAPPAAGIFADVPLNDPFAAWVERLFTEGVTSGCGTDPLRYCPERSVTRGEMAVFLLRAKHGAGYQARDATGTFADVPPGHPYAPWIEQLAEQGITGGCGINPARYCPDRPVTRGEMAVFLVRAFDLAL
ncbi:MAG: S-layer homology domain-containing protein, partial [Candidatus Eiseniibacteriota bacterium]